MADDIAEPHEPELRKEYPKVRLIIETLIGMRKRPPGDAASYYDGLLLVAAEDRTRRREMEELERGFTKHDAKVIAGMLHNPDDMRWMPITGMAIDLMYDLERAI